MSALVIGAAKEAIAEKTGLSDLDEGSEGKIKGKKITPWSFKLLIVGCIVGAVAAVAALIFQMYPLMVACIVLCVTSGFGAYHVKKLGVLKTLEGFTKELAERVKTLASKTLELKQVNDDLERVTGGLKQIPKDWRREIQRGKEMLEERTQELDRVASKLELAEKKLQALGKISLQMQEHTGKLTEAALQFSKDNDFLGSRVKKVQGHLEELQGQNEGLDELITRLDNENDQTDEIIKRYTDQNKAFKQMFKLMKEMYLAAKEKMALLQQEVISLRNIVPQAVESTSKVQELADRYEEMIRSLDERLLKLNKYREGYKRWVTWTHSEEFKEYMKTKGAD